MIRYLNFFTCNNFHPYKFYRKLHLFAETSAIKMPLELMHKYIIYHNFWTYFTLSSVYV